MDVVGISPPYAHGPGAKTKDPAYMFPSSVSVRGAVDVRSAHTRPTGMCLAYWSVSRGPKACELRLLQVLRASAGAGEFEAEAPRVVVFFVATSLHTAGGRPPPLFCVNESG